MPVLVLVPGCGQEGLGVLDGVCACVWCWCWRLLVVEGCVLGSAYLG